MMLPVVCTDAGGLPENVVQGKTGIIVPRRDAAALGDALARLAGDPALRSQMGSAGRSRVSSEFLLRNQIAAFGALYDLAFAQLPVAGNGASRLSLENDGAR
jgi:colanic acid/amylovoran biosynthesis glycosyltransferase